MSDYELYTGLEQQKVPLQLRRLDWERLEGWLTNYLKYGVANNSLEHLIKCGLIQIFIKVCKRLERLRKKGKAMNSLSTLHFTPLEKYCFRYVFSIEAERIEAEQGDQTFYIAYLQPILDQLQQHQINTSRGWSKINKHDK